MGDFRPRGARYTLSPRDFSLNTRNHRQLLPARDTGTRGPVVELLTTPARAGEVLPLAKLVYDRRTFSISALKPHLSVKRFYSAWETSPQGHGISRAKGWSHLSTSTLCVYRKFSAHPVPPVFNRSGGDSRVPRWMAGPNNVTESRVSGFLAPTAPEIVLWSVQPTPMELLWFSSLSSTWSRWVWTSYRERIGGCHFEQPGTPAVYCPGDYMKE